MSINWKYPDLDRLGRLYPHPSIVLRQRIWYTRKFDGSCKSMEEMKTLIDKHIAGLKRKATPIKAIYIEGDGEALITSRDPNSPTYYRITQKTWRKQEKPTNIKEAIEKYGYDKNRCRYALATADNLVILQEIQSNNEKIEEINKENWNLRKQYTDRISQKLAGNLLYGEAV